jgi:hypothetical protein
MIKQTKNKKIKKHSCELPCGKCCNGAIYGLGFIGAAIYYISNATGFWSGVLGILKSIVWPVFIVYKSLKFLGI